MEMPQSRVVYKILCRGRNVCARPLNVARFISFIEISSVFSESNDCLSFRIPRRALESHRDFPMCIPLFGSRFIDAMCPRLDASFVATFLFIRLTFGILAYYSCASLGDGLAALRYAAKIYWPFVIRLSIFRRRYRSSVMAFPLFYNDVLDSSLQPPGEILLKDEDEGFR